MLLQTPRLELRTITQKEAQLYLDYLVRNMDFLNAWEPAPGPDFLSLSHRRKQIIVENRKRKLKSEYRFYISKRGESAIIGTVGISSIVYGPFLSCFLGYRLDKDELNKGYMTEAISAIVNFAFDELGLHRIEANIMPRNAASRRTVEKVGFVQEGISPRYLKINGAWEDHAHYVLLNEHIRIGGPIAESKLETCFGIVKRSIDGLRAAGIDQWDEVYPSRETVLADLKAGHVFAAIGPEGILATVVLNEDQSKEWEAAAWPFPQSRALVVHRLVVDPAFQGKGIAKRLMVFTENYAKARGYSSIRLDAFPQNTVSVKLYEKLGYQNAGTVAFRKGHFYCFEKGVE